MDKSKELVQQAGIVPNLQLAIKQARGGVKSTGPQTVKIIDEKLVNTTDYETGSTVPTMRYVFEDLNGEKRQYDVPVKDKNGNLHYLIQRLAEFNSGDVLVLECMKKGIKNYISVVKADEVEQDIIEE